MPRESLRPRSLRPSERPLPQRLLEPLTPPVRTLRHYRRADARHDLLAGLTVAVVDLPQSMAMALIAGVPPVYGLYTSIVLGLFGALFTSSRFLSVGPTNTQSLLCAAVVSRLTDDPRLYLELVFGLCLIKGLIQLAFGAAGVGRLARYVSRSVMLGFTAAAAILIITGQLGPLLGLQPVRAVHDGLPGALGTLEDLLARIDHANLYALALGSLSLLVLLLARRLPPFVPGPLLAVVAGAVAAAALAPGTVALIGALPRGLPAPRLPQLTLAQAESLLSGALALALLGTLESVIIAKGMARRLGERIKPDQEFFGQGLANALGGLLQCMPGSASFSRTALLARAGARTRFAGLFCSVSTAALFFGVSPLTAYVPQAALAAVLCVLGAGLIDAKAIAQIARTSRTDAVVCGVTFASALLLPLAYAIYLGIFLNLALYLRRASRLHVSELVQVEGGGFEERPLARHAPVGRELVFLQLEGDLFFAVADELEERLVRLLQSDVRVAIIRLKRAHWIDASALFVFEQFVQAMHEAGGHVVLCGVRPELRGQLRDFGLDRLIGDENVLTSEPGAFASALRAFERGRQLLAVSHELAAARARVD